MAAPQQQPPLPPQWHSYPTVRPARRGLPAAIIGAAILIAAALVAAALIISNGNTPAATKMASGASGTNNAADSTTCEAWKATYADLQAIPALPAGWDWNTPNIDTIIKKTSAAVNRALNLFETAIAAEPALVAAAALDYIAAKRTEVGTLTNHTHSDSVSVDVTLTTLNRLCGIKS